MKPIRVCSIINGTGGEGGAERMLQRVIRRGNTSEFEHLVLSIRNFQQVAAELSAEGINVQSLNVQSAYYKLPHAVLQLASRIRKFKPDVIQSWMYMADFFGGIASHLASPATPVIWTIRHATLDPAIDSRALRGCAAGCARLSRRIPSKITLNSHAAVPTHVAAGYEESKMQVIPNGFDVERFAPSPQLRVETRARLGIPQDVPVVGRVARFHANKDHITFLKAARQVLTQRPDVRFLVCGEPQTITTRQVQNDINSFGLTDAVQLVELQSDIVPLNCSFDIATCSSLTEAFPNVLGEAMSCAVPCVSTDVGDAAQIIADTGRIVPPLSPSLFAEALLDLLNLPDAGRRQLGHAARQRVIDNYELTRSTETFLDLWRQLAGRQTDTTSSQRRAA
ncbi:MAG: glycosyltransferase [Planctomycetota bacterium]|nr:glycosyltransferase [Planctomycetota bacterium]